MFYIILFLSPLVALEVYVRQPSVDEFSAKHKFLEENKNDCEVLLMGSSHSQTGLNPEWLDYSAVNVANFSQPFYYDYKILEEYIGELPSLKAVVLSLSYPVFFSGPTERQENLYSIHWGLEPYSGKKNIDNYSAVLALGLENAINRLGSDENYFQHNGWYEADEIYSGRSDEAKEKVEVWHGMMYEEEWEDCSEWLNKIVAICRDYEVQLYLFFPPFSKNINSLIKNDRWQKKIHKHADALSVDSSVIIIDTNDNSVYNDELFRDPDHVNKKGAEILTKTINDLISSPLSNR